MYVRQQFGTMRHIQALLDRAVFVTSRPEDDVTRRTVSSFYTGTTLICVTVNMK